MVNGSTSFVTTAVGKIRRSWVVAKIQNRRFWPDGNIVAGADEKFPAIEHAAEIDDIARAKINFPSVQKPAAHLHRNAVAAAAQIDFQIAAPDVARRDFANEAVVKGGGHAAKE